MHGIKIPLKNSKPVYFATIKQALNGYIVVVEEDAQPHDSETLPGIEEQMQYVKNALSNFDPNADNELQNILRKNNMKPEDGEVKIKKVGVRIFSTFSEASAFLSFVFEEDKKD
jgi:uncharacterized protein (UPF0210 family)